MLTRLQRNDVKKVIFVILKKDWKTMQKFADKYTDGNVSAWIRICIEAHQNDALGQKYEI